MNIDKYLISESKSEVVSLYVTKTGIDAMKIKKDINNDGKVRYSWIGKFGAGGGLTYKDMLDNVNLYKRIKKGMKLKSGKEFSEVKD